MAQDTRSSAGSTLILENEDEEVTPPCRATSRKRKRCLDSESDDDVGPEPKVYVT